MITLMIDEQIPLVQTLLDGYAHIITYNAHSVSKQAFHQADALLVRSVTPIQRDDLTASNIQFLGSATAGIDHIDTDYLQAMNIHFAYAPGANANAVANYTLTALLSMEQARAATSSPNGDTLRAAVIGVGAVGSRVSRVLSMLGFEVFENDPPRAEDDNQSFTSTPLESLSDLDLLCCHTPLTSNGPHPTHHLIDEAVLSRQSKDCIVINAGRGEVIAPNAILSHRKQRFVLDVFPNEPSIDPRLIDHAAIATPHIAGHSNAAKKRASAMLITALCEQFNFPSSIAEAAWDQVPLPKTLNTEEPGWRQACLMLNPITKLSDRLKALTKKSGAQSAFIDLRAQYTQPEEFIFSSQVEDFHLQ